MPAPPPSLSLHLRVRLGFILQGSTLKAWCRQNGVHSSNARAALVGFWNGPGAKRLRERIVKAARIDGIPEAKDAAA
jgi:hypothetical protein